MPTLRGGEWDWIVVGAGSAGCAVAHQLSKRGDHKILVIEAGGSDRSPFIRIPALVQDACKRFDWGYVSQPDPSRNSKTDAWLRGQVLGGSSSINGMVFVRGARHDFDRWAALGNCGWSFEDVLPLFQEMEHSDQSGPDRGRSGPLSVTTVKEAHPLTQAFVRAAVTAGYAFNRDYNGPSQEGVSYAQLSQRNGLRCSAADAFLKSALSRHNVHLVLQGQVQKIHLENGRATGVIYLCHGATTFATARNVVVCAGALNSPKLLMLSGIGDPAELQSFGITPQLHLPEVGQNLLEHPLLPMVFRTRIPSNNLTQGWSQRLKIAADFAWRRQGPICNIFEALAFLRTCDSEVYPDVQLHYFPYAVSGSSHEEGSHSAFPGVTVYINKSHPRSRGRIRLKSADPADPPVIESRLLAEESDLQTMVRGVGMVRKIMANSPIYSLIESEVRPGIVAKDPSSTEDYVRSNTGIAYHPAGTCRMGVNGHSVVTPDLRVKGAENVWIADASVMPDLISGNTNAVCMMIGMKLGKQLAQDKR